MGNIQSRWVVIQYDQKYYDAHMNDADYDYLTNDLGIPEITRYYRYNGEEKTGETNFLMPQTEEQMALLTLRVTLRINKWVRHDD